MQRAQRRNIFIQEDSTVQQLRDQLEEAKSKSQSYGVAASWLDAIEHSMRRTRERESTTLISAAVLALVVLPSIDNMKRSGPSFVRRGKAPLLGLLAVYLLATSSLVSPVEGQQNDLRDIGRFSFEDDEIVLFQPFELPAFPVPLPCTPWPRCNVPLGRDAGVQDFVQDAGVRAEDFVQDFVQDAGVRAEMAMDNIAEVKLELDAKAGSYDNVIAEAREMALDKVAEAKLEFGRRLM
jgi:hypothetical protein